jgi:hypothetical protein
MRGLLGPALDEELNRTVVGLLLFLGEVAGGKFSPLPVIM